MYKYKRYIRITRKGYSLLELVIVVIIIGILMGSIIEWNKGVVQKTKVNAFFTIMDKITSELCPNYVLSNTKGNIYIDQNKKNVIKVPKLSELLKEYNLNLNDKFFQSLLVKNSAKIKVLKGNCYVEFKINKKLFDKYKSLPIFHSNVGFKQEGKNYLVKMAYPIFNGLSGSLLRTTMFYQYVDRAVYAPGTFQQKGNNNLMTGNDILLKYPWGTTRPINRFQDGMGRVANRNIADLEELPYYDKKKKKLNPIPAGKGLVNYNHLETNKKKIK